MTVPAAVRSASLIAEMPEDERPRERLLEHGAQVLSDAELLAVLLKSGCQGVSALDLARDLLATAGGLPGLAAVGSSTLRRRGVGNVKLSALLAAVEVGCRMAVSELPRREPLTRPSTTVRYLRLRYSARDQEVMGALYLDTRHGLLGERLLYRGTLNRAAVEPREILKEGLLCGAAGVVLFHTHPSGDPSPSAEDLMFTRRMAEAGEVVGIRMIDHLIVGTSGRWCSLRQRGAF